MSARNPILYLPPQLADELRRNTPTVLTGDEAWKLARFVEQVFQAGYDAGYVRGQVDGHEYHRRPKDDEVKALRGRMVDEGLIRP